MQPSISPNDIRSAVSDALTPMFGDVSFHRPIVLGGSSRGIPNYGTIFIATAKWFQKHGAEVVVIPAMGSHGGKAGPAHGQEQLELLRTRHGIAPAELPGIDFDHRIETQVLGKSRWHGVDVHLATSVIDRGALLFPVGRIFPHSHFQKSRQSGLVFGSGCRKMLAIGFTKFGGAKAVHAASMALWPNQTVKDTETLGDVVLDIGNFFFQNQWVAGGLGIIDNSIGQTAELVACSAEDGFQAEFNAFPRAAAFQPNLPVRQLDALIVNKIGKDISGTGGAPQVLRRWPDARKVEDPIPVLAIRQLSTGTHGSAFGVGFADIVTQQLVDQIDRPFTDTNTFGAGDPELGYPPETIASNDEELFRKVLKRTGKTPENVKLLYIRDTKRLTEMWCSPALVNDVRSDSTTNVSVEDAIPVSFTTGRLDSQFLWS